MLNLGKVILAIKKIFIIKILIILALELKTAWDGKLSYMISPALANYELERISNFTYGNEEFKQSVKNYVPEGYTFKGFPFQSNDMDTDKIYSNILANEVKLIE